MSIDPVTLTAISAGVSALGGIATGIASAQAANYQAKVAENNAKIAQQNAVYAAHAGEAKAQQESLRAAARNAAVKGAMAANGVDVNTGSAVDVQASSAAMGSLSTENVMREGQMKSYGYRTQAQDFKDQAGLYRQQASSAMAGGLIKGFSSLLSGASSLSSGKGASAASGGSYSYGTGMNALNFDTSF